ncbi:MAG: hypothetical protein MUC87_17460 [Bacteroidia bacterium]|jgi:hypothetical protein|nr:hypothetical protein [Bacteroidia bacterium]
MKHYILTIAIIIFGINPAFAQDKFEPRKWEIGYSLGSQSGVITGIPPSRNALNRATAGNTVYVINPDLTTRGLTFDFLLHRIFGKHRFGIQLSSWRMKNDNLSLAQTDSMIKQDTLRNFFLTNSQSYAMVGISYNRQIYRTKNNLGRFSVHLSFFTGLSVNLTPDRVEFDYYAPEGYILRNQLSDSSGVYLVGTEFKSGFFINPAIQIRFRTKKSRAFTMQMGYAVNWHKTEPVFGKIIGPVTSPVIDSPLMQVNKYIINSRQIKFYYSF